MTTDVPLTYTEQGSATSKPSRLRGRLFVKYVTLIVAVVSIALLTNGLFEIWFSYQEHKASLVRIQHEQAQSAAAKISQFIKEIENQVGWTTQLPWSVGTIEQRRFDALRLLRQVPAITEIAEVDASGKEQLRVSRLAMDVVGSGIDLSKDPKYIDAIKNKVYYGPVYFRRESEPYMTLALAGTRRDAGVSIAEVNLKLIWDVVSQIKVGERGHAYVVDAKGRLIAHPDISLVLRNTDMTRLPQVRAAHNGKAAEADEDTQVAQDLSGREVLTAYSKVTPLAWTVFVELPLKEAYAPLYASVERTGLLLIAALCLAALAGLFLARRMMVPVQALNVGAAKIGSGDLTQRISVKTGDELEALADQFNDMAGRLQESYADLENKVNLRTRELARSLEDLRMAQDRLVQTEKLASLGQLTAGIAHEIKNPLNFVNNFSAVSMELIDELRQMLAGADLNNQQRAEFSDISEMLQSNLNKVVQHGKRADAIVKNMLLHSRQGSGEHRLVDINAIVEESLNLAYHGARAEKQGFNIALERSFDPTAGQVDVFPQDITRALLNIISNGFYAATKRTELTASDGYEPTLGVATRNLGDRVEIRIRDNGTGIPLEVKEKMFNPFFTTKPAGEGTGLGLSISHDIIVKQHFGSIEVKTEPSNFTEFRIILPRNAALPTNTGAAT